jgi:hypothetical protein
MTAHPMRAFGFVAALAWSVISVQAQQAQTGQMDCKIYFVMYQFDSELGLVPIPNVLTTDQHKWFEKNAAKKYPGLCMDAEKATYVMVTVRWKEGEKQMVTRTHTASTSDPVTEVIGTTASDPRQPAQPIWGTRLERYITTWQTQEAEVVSRPHAVVLTFQTEDGKPLGTGAQLKTTPPPLIQKGYGAKPTKEAFEWSLGYIALVLRAHSKQAAAK